MRAPAFPERSPTPTLNGIALRIGPAWSTISEALVGTANLKRDRKFSKISGWYLIRVRPVVAAAEQGRVPDRRRGDRA